MQNFIKLDGNACLALPEHIQDIIKACMEENDYAYSKAESPEAAYTGFTQRYFPLFYHAGDHQADTFSFGEEGGIILINGSLTADRVELYGITDIYITGNLTTDIFILQDSHLVLSGDLTVTDQLVLSDTDGCCEVQGTLRTPTIISTFDGEYHTFGRIEGVEKTFLAVDSYGCEPEDMFFSRLGLPEPEELDYDETSKMWEML